MNPTYFEKLRSKHLGVEEIDTDTVRARTIFSDKKIYRIVDNVKLKGNHICESLSLLKYGDSYEVTKDNVLVYFQKDDLVIYNDNPCYVSDIIAELDRPKYLTKIYMLTMNPEKIIYGSSYPMNERPYYRPDYEIEKANNGPITSIAKYVFVSSGEPSFIELGSRLKKTIVGYDIKGEVQIKDLGVTLNQGDKYKVIWFEGKWMII